MIIPVGMMVLSRAVFAAGLAISLTGGIALAQTPPSVATPSGAQAAVKPTPVPDPHWLSPDEIKALIAAVPPPPAPGSAADQADLKTEIDVQNSRTPERSEQAKKDALLSLALFLQGIEPAVNAKSDPKLYFFFDQVRHEESAVNRGAKAVFQRPRPFVAHSAIHPLGTIGEFSYPSGHATFAFCHAVILGQIFPDHAAEFLEIAKRLAQSRVVLGVHYTTDIVEGERDGREIARELLTKPDFVARLDEVKAEVGRQAQTPAH